MLRLSVLLTVAMLACIGSSTKAAAQHELANEFRGTHFALSIDRFMGVDYTDYSPGDSQFRARILLNASEAAPSQFARFGFDVFFERFSVGLGGGFTSEGVGIAAPRVGYLFGITPELGFWLRGGMFYAKSGNEYLGFYGEGLLAWFPYRHFALTFGPTIDLAFGTRDRDPDYVSFGILQLGMTVFL